MSETPKERWARLANTISRAYHHEPRAVAMTRGYEALDALLAALEPPVADMVRRGVVEETGTVSGLRWYRPRSEP